MPALSAKASASTTSAGAPAASRLQGLHTLSEALSTTVVRGQAAGNSKAVKLATPCKQKPATPPAHVGLRLSHPHPDWPTVSGTTDVHVITSQSGRFDEKYRHHSGFKDCMGCTHEVKRCPELHYGVWLERRQLPGNWCLGTSPCKPQETTHLPGLPNGPRHRRSASSHPPGTLSWSALKAPQRQQRLQGSRMDVQADPRIKLHDCVVFL
jgi:hypothetical protein